MMKFKIGDKVRVKESVSWGDTRGGIEFIYDMEKYIGKIICVEDADSEDNTYLYGGYWFCEEWLEEVEANKTEIKIKYLNDDIEKLNFIENKSDWIDLRCASKEDIILKAGEFKLIPLGIAMELPEGYEAHVVPRSSTFKNFGIIQTNHQAVIDESYCGDNDWWFYPVYALRDTVIKFNDRICQFRIIKKMPSINFSEVETLNNKDRGGHGSTGVK